MTPFMADSFLLNNLTARKLYKTAASMPIFDYHCHLSPFEIYKDKVFYNLTELWLEGDHYKWRIMRAFGIDEQYITGSAAPKEKFLRFAEALPAFIGNPVYHWAHLELKRYFDIALPICSDNAEKIWSKTLKIMADGSFSAQQLIARSAVKAVVTTDDPSDSLEYHLLLQKEPLPFKVLPCFRPDAAVNIEKEGFAAYIFKLADSANAGISDFDSLLGALGKRLDYFCINGAVAADIAIEDFPKGHGDTSAADRALKAALKGEKSLASDIEEYKFALIKALASMFAAKGMVMQLHTGVIRNVNSRRFSALGADTGIDSVGNAIDITAAARLFDSVEREGGLPKTVVYTLNPNSYYPLSTLAGDFAGEVKGKMQLGAAWWFLDHRDGIREQLRILASTGGLGLFNGMLTDSRSFTSYARHDYFRRILCDIIGEWVEKGEYPDDTDMLEKLVKDICYDNAVNYFLKGADI